MPSRSLHLYVPLSFFAALFSYLAFFLIFFKSSLLVELVHVLEFFNVLFFSSLKLRWVVVRSGTNMPGKRQFHSYSNLIFSLYFASIMLRSKLICTEPHQNVSVFNSLFFSFLSLLLSVTYSSRDARASNTYATLITTYSHGAFFNACPNYKLSLCNHIVTSNVHTYSLQYCFVFIVYFFFLLRSFYFFFSLTHTLVPLTLLCSAMYMPVACLPISIDCGITILH